MKKYFLKVKNEIIGRLFFHLIYIVAIAGLPYVIKMMLDNDYSRGIKEVITLILLFISLIFIGMLSQYLSQRISWKLDTKFFVLLRKDLFFSIINKCPKDFKSKEIGDYSSMLNNDIASCGEYLSYFMLIIESIIGIITYAVYLFLLDYRIAIMMYICTAIMIFLPRITGEKLSIKKQNLLTMTGDYITKIIDLLNGYSVINNKTCKAISNRHETSLKNMENSRYDYGKFKTFVNVFNGSIMYLINISTFVIIAILLYKKQITGGIATATFGYIGDFSYPLRTLIDSISNLKSVEGVKNRIIKNINPLNINEETYEVFKDKITFNNICFKYDTFEINNFTCNFNKGKKYAIIGESGTGKSTILNLLTGFLEADSGDIQIDNKKLSRYMSNNLIFYLTQDSHIFMEPFWENITIYDSFKRNPEFLEFITEDRRDFIMKSKDCSNLSGGEKQLVNIVKALSSNCNILALDEPFSALDSKSEMEVCKKLLSLKDKTIIMITHNQQEEYLKMFDEKIVIRKLNNNSAI